MNGGNGAVTELRDESLSKGQQQMVDDVMQNAAVQKFGERLQKLKTEILNEIDEKFSKVVGEVLQQMEDNGIPPQETNQVLYDKVKYSNRLKSSKEGGLPSKHFLARESLLNNLFKIKHFHTIYNIFIAMLLILLLNTAVYDLVVDGNINLGLSLIHWNFCGLHLVTMVWLGMLASVLVVYGGFDYWAHHRIKFVTKSVSQRCWDYGGLCVLICYEVLFGIIPAVLLLKFDLPPASSLIILTEQCRLIMKVYAFVRSNAPRALAYKPHSDGEDSRPSPNFSHFLYFLFVPTLVYRDSYPRTKMIHWRLVTWHFMEVVGIIFYMSFLIERFFMPAFKDFGIKRFSPEKLVASIFSLMMPGTLIFLCSFFGLLHSWMNAFAEITMFADRMFYKDWWNADSYGAYYRMWNVIVHDWLYTYVYRDCCVFFKSNQRIMPMLVVFIVSAVVHEYIISLTLRFFYPVLFVAFGCFSVFFLYITAGSRKGGNLFMWLTLCFGVGLLGSGYSMEWYARMNCPPFIESNWDYFVPRSWFCKVPA